MYLFIVGFYSGLHRAAVVTTGISRPICEMWKKDNHRCLHIHLYCFLKYVARKFPLRTNKHTNAVAAGSSFPLWRLVFLRHLITTRFGSAASHEVKSSPASMSFNKERTFVPSSVQPTTSLLRTYINATVILRLNSVFVYESNSCIPRGPLSNMIDCTLHYWVSIPGKGRHFRLRY